MQVEFFVNPVSGWMWWTPVLLVEDGPRSDEERKEALQRPAGQGLVLRLLGRVGAWFGVCEQTPTGAWRWVRVVRQEPCKPGARRNHTSAWSWWC